MTCTAHSGSWPHLGRAQPGVYSRTRAHREHWDASALAAELLGRWDRGCRRGSAARLSAQWTPEPETDSSTPEEAGDKNTEEQNTNTEEKNTTKHKEAVLSLCTMALVKLVEFCWFICDDLVWKILTVEENTSHNVCAKVSYGMSHEMPIRSKIECLLQCNLAVAPRLYGTKKLH